MTSLRKRGWSDVRSSSEDGDGDEEGAVIDDDGRGDAQDGDGDGDDGDESAKVALMRRAIPSAHAHRRQPQATTGGGGDDDDDDGGGGGNECVEGDEDDGDEVERLFVPTSDEDDDDGSGGAAGGDGGPIARRKRARVEPDDPGGGEGDANDLEGGREEWERRLLDRRGKMSKWATRLFDPDRPRGLVETPEAIPLNDEFLQDFGRREREFDAKLGRSIEDIIVAEGDAEGDGEGSSSGDDGGDEKEASQRKKKVKVAEGCKVRLANLTFTTKAEAIEAECKKYGTVLDVNLIMDRDDPTRSSGRCYVVFGSPEEASKCVAAMNERTFAGRVVRVGLVAAESRPGGRGGGGAGSSLVGGKMSRYWERDISTRCRRCLKIGHMADQCPNAEARRPCPICASTDGHDSRDCKMACVCYNCSMPGHASRDCPVPRGAPKRLLCALCFSNGHHRWHCRAEAWQVNALDAKCFDCGRYGHFSCGGPSGGWGGRSRLDGYECFNCGHRGHHGAGCVRPVLEACTRNGCELGLREIERSESWIDVMEESTSSRDRVGRGRERNGNSREGGSSFRSNGGDPRPGFRRASSQPPPGQNRGEFSNVLPGRFQPPPPPPPGRGYQQPRQAMSGDPRFQSGFYHQGR